MNPALKLFDDLIAPLEEKMITSVWRIVRSQHDFDEAFQLALTTIWKRLNTIHRHPHPTACVLRICVNSGFDVMRRKMRQRKREAEEAISENLVDPSCHGAENLIAHECEVEIFEAISKLPHAQSEAVLMRFTQGLSYQEIAHALECSEATARQNICRAREKLAKMLNHLLPPSLKENTP